MSAVWENIDLDLYLRARLSIFNDTGGRGWESGVRIFDCPFCGDHRARGWCNIARWSAGCWNLGCPAEPRLLGGALEWVRRREGFQSRGETWTFLLRTYRRRSAPVQGVSRSPKWEDFCRFPKDMILLSGEKPGRVLTSVLRFLWSQWGLSLRDAERWGLGVCLRPPYVWRIIIPVLMGKQPVAFQARTIRSGVEPKYLTSHWGQKNDPRSECGRPARALLFNYDGLLSYGEALLVEGPGDVMAWSQREPLPAVALLGTMLTPEKLSLLREKGLKRVIVALDAEPEAQRRAQTHLEDLEAWGIPGVLGHWRGGKDAGMGASLEVEEKGSFRDQIASRMDR